MALIQGSTVVPPGWLTTGDKDYSALFMELVLESWDVSDWALEVF